MKSLILAAVAAVALAGCVAVPATYPGDAYYYPAPAIGVGIYSAPAYHHQHHRYYRRHHHRW